MAIERLIILGFKRFNVDSKQYASVFAYTPRSSPSTADSCGCESLKFACDFSLLDSSKHWSFPIECDMETSLKAGSGGRPISLCLSLKPVQPPVHQPFPDVKPVDKK